MKKFSELTDEQLVSIVKNSKKMRDEFCEYIQDTEMSWIGDKLDCVRDSLSDYSIGYYDRNYINVRDYESFVDGVAQSSEWYGASDKLEKKLAQCQKLVGTNLFEYHAEQLKELWLKEELQSMCDFVEDICCKISNGDIDSKDDYFECFIESYSDYLYDETAQTYYEPKVLDAA